MNRPIRLSNTSDEVFKYIGCLVQYKCWRKKEGLSGATATLPNGTTLMHNYLSSGYKTGKAYIEKILTIKNNRKILILSDGSRAYTSECEIFTEIKLEKECI